MATEKQGRQAGARNQNRRRAHQLRNGQDRLAGGCDRVGRSRGTACLLLPSAGPEGVGVQSNFVALQDQAYLDRLFGCTMGNETDDMGAGNIMIPF